MPLSVKPLPVHSLSHEDALVQVRRVEHKNPYDFTREHRHTYFEIFFFETGGGSQLIDFRDYPVRAHSCYIVFPQQIHLMKRAPEATGNLVQFGEEIITSMQLRTLLQQHFFSDSPAIVFENEPDKFLRMKAVLDLLTAASLQTSSTAREIALFYLQALLLQLLEGLSTEAEVPLSGERKMLFAFQQLLEGQFSNNHQVGKYAAALNITEKKLAGVTKKYIGQSPLQVIHNRLLLESKRLLLFEDIAHKEIAFKLGFDSPASFSLFIKNKTGFTPSELNCQLVNFYR